VAVKNITNQSSSPTKNVGWMLRTKRASLLISGVMCLQQRLNEDVL